MSEPHYRSWEPLLPPAALARGPLVVVAPHPDDEVIGAAGLILGHVDAGQSVTVVVLSDGAQGIPGTDSGPAYAEVRKKECRKAADELGVSELRFLNLPDGSLRERVAEAASGLHLILDELKPASLAFPSPFELHPDHKAACLAAGEAIVGLDEVPELYAYEVGSLMPTNLLLDVSGLQERKHRALLAYASQIEHHDIPAKVRALDVARTANVPMPEISHCEGYLRIAPGQFAEYREKADELAALIDAMTPSPPHDRA